MNKKPLGVSLLVVPLLLASCSNRIIRPDSSTSTSSFAPPPSTYYAKEFNVEEKTLDCSLIGVEKTFISGNKITIRYVPKANYDLGDIAIIEKKDNLYINYELNIVNSAFSFVMPDSDIVIDVKCYIHDPLPGIDMTNKDKEMLKKGYKNLIEDTTFKKGFQVRKSQNTSDYLYKNPIDTYKWGKKPSWNFTQWMTDYPVNPDKENGYYYKDDGMKHMIASGPSENDLVKSLSFDSETGDFNLTTNTKHEYKECTEIPYSETYGNFWWIHYLVEQEFVEPLSIHDHSSIIMTMDYEVDKSIHLCDFFYNYVQLGWYVTVANKNKKSLDYDTYMWFGFDMFNNRDIGREDPGYYAFEHGSNVAIFRPNSNAFLSTKVMPKVGDKVTLSVEINDFLMSAYYSPMFKSFWGTTEFEDLYISSMNLGFEVFGGFDISTNFSNVGIYFK